MLQTTMNRSCLWLLLLFTLSHRICWSSSCLIDPLAPLWWVKDGIVTAAKGTKLAVTGVAKGVKGAYNLANPTEPPLLIIGGTAAEPPKSGYRPMGCYKDKARKRDLPFEGGSGKKMNKDTCSSKCGVFSAKYFGLQSSQNPDEKGFLECWCGHHFGKYGEGTVFDCQNRCPSEEVQKNELCGGDMYNSVYENSKSGYN